LPLIDLPFQWPAFDSRLTYDGGMVSVPFVSGGWLEAISLERAKADVDRVYAAMARIADRCAAGSSPEGAMSCHCAGELGVRAAAIFAIAASSVSVRCLRASPVASVGAFSR
jgi:hypothetical protein